MDHVIFRYLPKILVDSWTEVFRQLRRQVLSTQLTQNTGVTWILLSVCFSIFSLEHFEMSGFKHQSGKTIVKAIRFCMSQIESSYFGTFSAQVFIYKGGMYFVSVVQNVHRYIQGLSIYRGNQRSLVYPMYLNSTYIE